MDRSVKERLVGAVVLVALGVWLIPWLLDGQDADESESASRETMRLPVPAVNDARPPQSSRTRTIEIEVGPNASPNAVQTVVDDPDERAVREALADESRAEPSTAAAIKAPTSGSARDLPVAARASDAEVEASKTPAASAAPTEGKVSRAKPASTPSDGWMVQLGSFGDEGNANRQAERVKTFGYEPKISTYSASGRPMYRVRVGPVETRERAEVTVSSLSAHGFVAQVIAPE